VRPGRRTKLLVKHLFRGDVAADRHLTLTGSGREPWIAQTRRGVECRASPALVPETSAQLLVERVSPGDLPDDSLSTCSRRGRRSPVRDGEVRAIGRFLARASARPRPRRAETDRAVGRSARRSSVFAHNTIEHMRRSASCSPENRDAALPPPLRDRAALVWSAGRASARPARPAAVHPHMRPSCRRRRGPSALEEAWPDIIVATWTSAGEATLMHRRAARAGRGKWGWAGRV